MSACAPAERLIQSIRVEAPGATDQIIELAMFNTMDEFFRRTSAWRVAQDVSLEEGVYEYPLNLPENSTVVRMLSVTHQGVPVNSSPIASASGGQTIMSLGAMVPEEVFSDGDAEYAPVASDLSGSIFTYAIYRPEYISITGVPDAEARRFPMQVVYSVSMARSCLECDSCSDWQIEEWMHDMYFQDWFDGALAKLMSMKAKPWTDTTLGTYHAKRFRNAMAYRKQESIRGFNWDKPMWRFPGTWARG